MKSMLLRIGIIATAIACLLLFACGFGRNLIAPWQVEEIELTGYNPESTIELKPAEALKLIMYYNLSRYVGEVQADRCDRAYYVCIRLKDGRQIGIIDQDDKRIKVTGMKDESFWADSPLLSGLIQNLIDDMP